MKSGIIAIVIIAAVVVLGWTYYQYGNPLEDSSNIASPTPSVSLRSNNGVVAIAHSETLGDYLTDNKGVTLYVFGDDKSIDSSCNDDCAQKWPPFLYDNRDLTDTTDPLLKNLNVGKRSDTTNETYQYAWGNKPLYYYQGDINPGDTNGNGIDMIWSVVIVK